MINPTDLQVTEVISEIVARAGAGFVYERPDGSGAACWYAWNGRPSCLVGQVLHQLGVTVERLSMIEETGVITASKLLRSDGVIDLSDKAVHALSGAQIEQDGGQTWGDALRTFHQRMN